MAPPNSAAAPEILNRRDTETQRRWSSLRLCVSAVQFLKGCDVAAPVRTAAVVTSAQNRARDLANTPANDLPPTALADYAWDAADRLGLTALVLEEEEIRGSSDDSAFETAAFPFGEAAPDTESLVVSQGVLQALGPHLAAQTNLLRLTG